MEDQILEKGMHELNIDPEFESLLDCLDKDEIRILEASIDRNGCDEPICVWDDVIVDGHNRYKICWKLNKPFPVRKIYFADRDEAILWMIEHQLGRRSVKAYQRTTLALRLEDLLAKQAKKSQGKRNDLHPNFPQNSAESSERHKETRERIAEKAGVSRDTVSRVKKLQKYADEDTKRKLRRGEVSINKAYTETIQKKREGETKICERCGKEKPVLEFPRSRGGTFYLPVCKECSSLDVSATATQPDSKSENEPSKFEEAPAQQSLELTYDRFDAYPDATRLDHPIEVPNNVGEPVRMPRPFSFVQGQVHFALKNMLKELRIGLNWLSQEDKSRIPELLGMLEEAGSQAEQMIKKEMED